MEVRSIRQRQEAGLGFKCFSVRVPISIYNNVTDWAWENRMSMAKAITTLLVEGLEARGKTLSESEVGQHGAKDI